MKRFILLAVLVEHFLLNFVVEIQIGKNLEQHSTMVSILASGPSCLRQDSQHSQIFFRGKFVDVGEINQQNSKVDSGLKMLI